MPYKHLNSRVPDRHNVTTTKGTGTPPPRTTSRVLKEPGHRRLSRLARAALTLALALALASLGLLLLVNDTMPSAPSTMALFAAAASLAAAATTSAATTTATTSSAQASGTAAAGQVDLGWYPPSSGPQHVNDLTTALDTPHGVYGFVFSSSQTPAGTPYGTYNWCNMPHARAGEYPQAKKGYTLKYVEVVSHSFTCTGLDCTGLYIKLGCGHSPA